MTVAKLWAALTTIEQRENLLDWHIGNVYLWPLVRMRLYREVAEAAGIFERLPERADVPSAALPHLDRRFDFAVVPFLRRNTAGVDPFSAPIADALQAEAITFGMGEHDIDSGRLQVEQLERDFLKRYRLLAKLLVLPTLRPWHNRKWQRVIAFFEAEFGVTLKSNRVFPRWLLVNFVAQSYGWFRLFKALGVRKVFVVNAWKRAMIAGAQRAKAVVVEPQHGLLSNMHPLLSFAGRNRVAYTPDELLVWGKYWAECSDLPAEIKTKVIGEPAALTQARALVAQRQPHTALFVSQAQHTTRLFETALHFADANPNFAVTVKPHPQEDLEQFTEHLRVLGRTKPANLHFAERDVAAINLIAKSEYVIGVYSMALVEAVGLSAKVIAVQLPGWENLSSIAERGDLVFADSATDPRLERAMQLAKSAADPSYYFAPAVGQAELAEILKATPTR
ncbi:MAG: hypothetical protein KGL77_04215 [Actinomycetales bacterium]|nr:hypothetical protein [Actinomycetales bacterium]